MEDRAALARQELTENLGGLIKTRTIVAFREVLIQVQQLRQVWGASMRHMNRSRLHPDTVPVPRGRRQ